MPLVALLVAAWAPAGAVVDEPRPSTVEEETGVHLVLVDAVVLDRQGRPVGDLTLDDFEVLVDRRIREVDTLDVACDEGGDGAGPAATAARDSGPPRVVIALDYQHLRQYRRIAVLESLGDELAHVVPPGAEVMVAALTGALRIEQAFTTDLDAVAASLDRMAHDVSLWQPDFRHANEEGFTEGLTALFDVLESVPGPKAVALYSEMQDVPLDSEFARLAARAAAARCAVYAVDAAGLLDPIQEAQLRLRPG